MSNLLKNLLFALGLAIIIWLGYILFIQNDEDPLISSNNAAASQQATLETQEFLSRLQDLRRVDLDGATFSDGRFTSLIDFRQVLVPEPTGRRNPFAPVR